MSLLGGFFHRLIYVYRKIQYTRTLFVKKKKNYRIYISDKYKK
jgi:hypothetical protein